MGVKHWDSCWICRKWCDAGEHGFAICSKKCAVEYERREELYWEHLKTEERKKTLRKWLSKSPEFRAFVSKQGEEG